MRERAAADRRWMARALALARRGEGLTRPNPPVGAVLVRGGRVVGEGFHARAGGPHAEAVALRRAGARARGATLYVTLEPCSTWGRTPPCTDAILAVGVRRVVAATTDPNPRHAGRGLRILRRAGIACTLGPGGAEARGHLEPFATWVLTGRPWVTLKLGVTLDGRIADRAGHSRWITGPQSRAAVQALRRRADAILVGRRTVELDDPSLRPRPARGRKPLRVIVASGVRLPLAARVFSDAERGRTLLATTSAVSASAQRRLEARGVRVVRLPGVSGRVSLPALLRDLGRRGVLHVLCEGGGELAGSLLRAGLADEIVLFVAPRVLGGDAAPAVGGRGWPLAEAPGFRVLETTAMGGDVMIRLRPEKPRRRRG